jgi:hypothetical protein
MPILNYRTVILASILICPEIFPQQQTPVSLHGQLQVSGNLILDQHDNPTQLRE